MSTAEIVPVRENADLEQKALTLVEQAKALRIVDQPSYELAAERLRGVADLRREIEAYHKPLKQKAFEAHRAICDAEAKLLKPVRDAEQVYRAGISGYEMEQRRIEEERRRKAEEEERRRLEAERESEIEQAEAEGADAEEVQAIVEAPLPAPVVHVEPTFQQVKGVSTATVWKARVASLARIVEAAAKGSSAAMSILQVNEVALNGLARSTRGTLQIPGVEFYQDAVVRAGRR